MATNFGLINQTYNLSAATLADHPTQWQLFAHELSRLNAAAPPNTTYKLLYMGRHGEGWHNAAESFYGTPAWNCYWAEEEGNGTASWFDADLTPAGVAQARAVNAFWKRMRDEQRIPLPQRYLVSPLTRCLRTAALSFEGVVVVDDSESEPWVPTVKEGLREGISIHTCNRRRRRAYIAAAYPGWRVERGFSEHDELWNGVTSETPEAQDARSRALLDDVFGSASTLAYDDDEGERLDATRYVSFTSHSGEIASLLRVLGHREFRMKTGAAIPVLVKAETARGKGPTTTAEWSTSAHCTEPPVTSIQDGACICPGGLPPVTTPLVEPTAEPYVREL